MRDCWKVKVQKMCKNCSSCIRCSDILSENIYRKMSPALATWTEAPYMALLYSSPYITAEVSTWVILNLNDETYRGRNSWISRRDREKILCIDDKNTRNAQNKKAFFLYTLTHKHVDLEVNTLWNITRCPLAAGNLAGVCVRLCTVCLDTVL